MRSWSALFGIMAQTTSTQSSQSRDDWVEVVYDDTEGVSPGRPGLVGGPNTQNCELEGPLRRLGQMQTWDVARH